MFHDQLLFHQNGDGIEHSVKTKLIVLYREYVSSKPKFHFHVIKCILHNISFWLNLFYLTLYL
jgi:hypothetical protein